MKERKIWIALTDYAEDGIGRYGNLIGNLYTYFLPGININKIRKILIRFSEEPDYFDLYQADDQIWAIIKTFDYISFNKSDHFRKCELLSDYVFECLRAFFTKFNIDLKDLGTAHKQIKEVDFKLKIVICGAPKQNRSKNVVAMVGAEYFLDYSLISINFYFKESDSNKVITLCKSYPTSFIYSRLFSNAKWIDNSNFLILNETKEINISINIDGNVSVEYHPISRDIESLKKEIKYLTQELSFQL
ncbi:hypothetical protein ACPPVU_11040 [Mucilaginibacter sp. McL0603]|uniref:hypothetical protein n=1 Tax=Mucilaginibacter sp. McL0603 TaxID=3415670 RepID=UPI003CEF46C5